MKKTLLTLALVASSLMANQLSKECSYLNTMNQQQTLSVPQDKTKVEKHMDCLFEFISKDQNKQLQGKRIDKNTVFEGMSYDKRTNVLQSSNIVTNIKVSTLKQNTQQAKNYTCKNQVFSSFLPYGLSMKTVFKSQEGKELHSFNVSQKDCK